jgi:hypothetical protein
MIIQFKTSTKYIKLTECNIYKTQLDLLQDQGITQFMKLCAESIRYSY